MANSLTYFISISVLLIAIMFMVDLAMDGTTTDEGLDSSTDIFNYEGSQISKFDNGNYSLDEDIASYLPTGEGTADIDETTGNIFTDTFSTIKNWLLDTSGVRFILGVLNALPNLVKLIMPDKYDAIAFGVGYIWNALVGVAIVFWLKGGGN